MPLLKPVCLQNQAERSHKPVRLRLARTRVPARVSAAGLASPKPALHVKRWLDSMD